MNYTYLHYQIGLSLLNGIGPVRAKAILRTFDDLEYFFNAPVQELKQLTGLKTSFINGLDRRRALQKAEDVILSSKKNNIKILFYTDLEYPRRLKNCPDAPLVIYTLGIGEMNPLRTVSIVGTRSATPYGKELCKRLIESFQDKNIVVISGLALGIDASVHRYCLEFGVPTFGVLGHGLDRIYPSQHRELASQMVRTGSLITEFIPGTNPDRENFPKRNRIVAGLSDATIVVESKLKGGSLITANLANDYNRDVFAFPGSVDKETSQGCNKLISSQRASLIQNPDEFLLEMGWVDKENVKEIQRSLFLEFTELQKSIIDLIQKDNSIQIDLLAIQSKIPISTLNSELFKLEMNGAVISLPGRKFQIA